MSGWIHLVYGFSTGIDEYFWYADDFKRKKKVFERHCEDRLERHSPAQPNGMVSVSKDLTRFFINDPYEDEISNCEYLAGYLAKIKHQTE